MSREIKFRAWDKDKKIMIYPSVIGVNLENFAWDHDLGWLHDCQEWYGEDGYIDNPTLMQYTGLKDKNDVEIWECDVIDLLWPFVGSTYRCVVVWHQQFGRWAMQEQVSGIYHYFGSQDTNLMNIERIGNIYQHPHLINQQAK